MSSDSHWIQFVLMLVVLSGFIFLLVTHNEDSIRHYTSHLTENEYIIPDDRRNTDLSVQAYYETRDKIVLNEMLTTRQTFINQYHVGTLFKDGFRNDLPEDAMWKDGKICIGPQVRKLRQAALEKK